MPQRELPCKVFTEGKKKKTPYKIYKVAETNILVRNIQKAMLPMTGLAPSNSVMEIKVVKE